jgi:regulator of sigma E protease
LQSLIAFLLVLGPLVFFHELGHFLVAKSLRIGVPVFSLGFGPRLFGLRRGETDYRVSLVPLGGYVRLTGDESDAERCGNPAEFLSRSRRQRFLVFVAGATFNVVLAFLAFWLLFGLYGKEEVADPDGYPTVSMVAQGSPAERAGLAPGDRILAIAGKDVRGKDAFERIYGVEIALKPNQVRALRVERDGREIDLALGVEEDPVQGHGAQPGWGLSWGGTPLISIVTSGDRADRAGIRNGDRVLGVDDLEPISRLELFQVIRDSAERELRFKIEREGRIVSLPVVPRDDDGVGKIGVNISAARRQMGLLEAAGESVRVNLFNSMMLFHVLKGMLTKDVPLKSVSGPIGIAQVARDALRTGPEAFLWLLGFFSLQLGILNLLPIPVLDGGHIMILGVEGLMRRELSERVKERVMMAGLAFLLLFMSAVIVNDVIKLNL